MHHTRQQSCFQEHGMHPKMGHPCTTPRQKMHLPQFQNSKTSVKNLLIFYRTLEMLNDGSYTFIKCGNLLNFHCFWPCQSFQSSISMSRATVGWKSNNSIAQKNIKHNQNSHYTLLFNTCAWKTFENRYQTRWISTWWVKSKYLTNDTCSFLIHVDPISTVGYWIILIYFDMNFLFNLIMKHQFPKFKVWWNPLELNFIFDCFKSWIFNFDKVSNLFYNFISCKREQW